MTSTKHTKADATRKQEIVYLLMIRDHLRNSRDDLHRLKWIGAAMTITDVIHSLNEAITKAEAEAAE